MLIFVSHSKFFGHFNDRGFEMTRNTDKHLDSRVIIVDIGASA